MKYGESLVETLSGDFKTLEELSKNRYDCTYNDCGFCYDDLIVGMVNSTQACMGKNNCYRYKHDGKTNNEVRSSRSIAAVSDTSAKQVFSMQGNF